MYTVVETPASLASAKEEGMTAAEMRAVVEAVSENPETGDVIKGAGGCRKVRIGGKGKGKSGGYRVVTYYTGKRLPVFLIAVLAKGTRANFSKAERNAMASLTKIIASGIGARRKKGAGEE